MVSPGLAMSWPSPLELYVPAVPVVGRDAGSYEVVTAVADPVLVEVRSGVVFQV